jgi:hypothetical protein
VGVEGCDPRTRAEVAACGGKDVVGGVAVAAFEMAAAEVTVGLHVTDHGFDASGV